MDVDAYLARIEYDGPTTVDARTLRALHIAHILSVPFENISIFAGEPIVLDDQRLFEKVVLRRRGGFCYELNGLFAGLLRELGFRVEMISAAVHRSAGDYSPDFAHMALMVQVEQRWLADVGYGDAFREPLLIDERGVQQQGDRAYRIDGNDEMLVLLESGEDGEWRPRYRFGLRPYAYPDYAEMCVRQQTDADSPFTQGPFCVRSMPEGRTWLRGGRLVTIRGAEREERDLADDKEMADALWTHFGIILCNVRDRRAPLMPELPKGSKLENSNEEIELAAGLARPAQRALAAAAIHSLEDLATLTEAEIKALHGIGPNALNALRLALRREGLAFRT